MNSKIYGKLAVTNLKNNGKSYIPYVLASAFSVMMYYIMDNLYRNRSLVEKGSPLAIMLSYAAAVLLIFSVIFLFYINSFLIKRRKKELGIYNILGMGKGHLGKMLFLESVITTGASIIGGILAGILFGKLVYLILLKILHMGGKIEYRISLASTGITTILFGAIFILIFLYNLLQMKLSNPIELLRGGNTGEREPKTKWIMTIIGILCLAGGYSIALTTKEPMAALGKFFIAVILVIIGTYALFMAGSIAFLKMLRNRKSYYYKTRHFTAVSGMIYRMKQNAVGLANICILSTMVLVMVSMTVSLYGGLNDVIATRFPYEAQITSSGINQKEEEQIEEVINNMTKKNHTVPTSQIRFHMGRFTTVYNNKTKKFDMMVAGDYTNSNAADLVMIPLSDYNQTEGKNVKLKENEVLLYHRNHNKNDNKSHKKSDTDTQKDKKVIQLNNRSYTVVDELDRLAIAKADTTSFIDGWYVVVKDSSIITSYLKEIYENSNIYDELKEYYGKIHYSYSFNLNGSRANRTKTEKSIQKQLQKKFANCSIESRELSRESFYELYGGFLFIGIFLGIIFLMATTLIIYYKQISEGYDDRERYQIMQKVGMSKKEVRQSIRSQVLLVFFLPLIMAVIHLAFAFKIITKLLSVLNLTNISLFFMYTVGTVAVFAVIYAIIYSITAREYYKILI
nr:ABC transporter permease [uncultured Anaerobutyricum sp.]